MPRNSQIEQQRQDFLLIVARTFSELGYRGTTSAELAHRCGVRENILYWIWKDKEAMYIASIYYVYDFSTQIWSARGTQKSGKFSLADVLDYESEHLGEFGYYRILFTGLAEVEDEEIREVLAKDYKAFHAFVKRHLDVHREKSGGSEALESSLAAWAIIGIGTVSTIGRETGSIGPRIRRRLLKEGGEYLAGTEEE